MKKKLVLWTLLLMLVLSACQPEDGSGVHTITLGSGSGATAVTVDMEGDTLTLDGVTYSYTKEDDRLVVRFTDTITMKSSREKRISWTGGYSADYEKYSRIGNTLARAYWLAYEDQAPPRWEFHPMMFLLGLGLIGIGIWHRRDPESVFEARHWRYSNLEPSEDGLEVIRLQAWLFWFVGFLIVCGSFG